jgi:hypothetical protein
MTPKKKQQIIIIEGPDMTGKTDIAYALSQSLKIPYYKDSAERVTYLNKPENFIHQLRHSHVGRVDFLNQTGVSVVLDRSWPSEWVYAPIMGRQTDWDVLTALDEEYARLGAKIILCEKSSYEDVVDDIDPSLTGDKLQQISGRYDLFGQWTQCETFKLNVDDRNLGSQIEKIVGWLNNLS